MYANKPIIPTLLADGVTKIQNYVTSATFTTTPLPIFQSQGYSAAFSCPATGAPAGTVKVQGCNDMTSTESRGGGPNGNSPDANLVNWFDVASGGDRIVSGAVSGATVVNLTDPFAMYRWIRLVYTPTGGSVTATVTIQAKSP